MAKERNPIKIMLIVLIVLVIGLIILHLMPQKITLEGTTGTVRYFGGDAEPEIPAPTTPATPVN